LKPTEPTELRDFLRSLASSNYASVTALAANAIPKLIQLLGYPLENLFFEPAGPPQTGWWPDAVIAGSRTAKPWIVFEVRTAGPKVLYSQWQEQVSEFARAMDAQNVVVLSPNVLILHSRQTTTTFLLIDLTEEQAAGLLEELSAPAKLPDHKPRQTRHTSLPKDECDEFRIDLQEYSALLSTVRSAGSPAEKGRALEDVAAALFDGLRFARVKHKNLQTLSSEIDLVVQNLGSSLGRTFFDDYGRYALVECKNWASAVGARHIRDFVGKLHKTQVKLGFLFATNGITGANCGEDALREVKVAFDVTSTLVVVLAEDHLEQVESGRCFDELLDAQVDRLRFDL
jgi:hypothetical protein